MHTDIPRDVLASLELVEVSLNRAGHEPEWWKWAIVACHMAASSALVGYLTSTNGIGALNPRSTRDWTEWHDLPNPRPNPPSIYLAEFNELVKRAVAGKQGFGDFPIDISSLADNLKRLNFVRNDFNHFHEQGWSIHIAYIRPLLLAAVSVVRLVEEHEWAFRHASGATRARMRSLVVQLDLALSKPSV